MQMLKSHLLAFSALLQVAALSMPVHAEYTGPTAEGDHTLAQILANPVDDQPVTLSGYLVKKLSYETYVFSDGTDEIQVELEQEDFPPQPFDENTRILIMGEVEVDHDKPVQIEIERLTIK